MQDNTSILNTHMVKQWFREMGILLVDWPLYLPDLNLVKHIKHVTKPIQAKGRYSSIVLFNNSKLRREEEIYYTQ
jgi:hypothetical protein